MAKNEIISHEEVQALKASYQTNSGKRLTNFAINLQTLFTKAGGEPGTFFADTDYSSMSIHGQDIHGSQLKTASIKGAKGLDSNEIYFKNSIRISIKTDKNSEGSITWKLQTYFEKTKEQHSNIEYGNTEGSGFDNLAAAINTSSKQLLQGLQGKELKKLWKGAAI